MLWYKTFRSALSFSSKFVWSENHLVIMSHCPGLPFNSFRWWQQRWFL